ncbi:glycoside hydrolase family 19 protein [Nocardia sp. R16R-3T]
MGSQYDPITGDCWGGAQYGLLPPKAQKSSVSPVVAEAREQIDKLAAPSAASGAVQRAVELARTAFRFMLDQLGTGNPTDLPEFPDTPKSTLGKYLPYLDQAMRDYGIDTPERAAAFLAQVGVETDDLKTLEEYGDKSYFERNYGSRNDLGNERASDGTAFHGRGALQLTGRTNYRNAGNALEVDFVEDPDKAKDPEYAFATAGWYWDSKDLNADADKSDIDAITYAINGGSNGSAERRENYDRARKVLDAE